MKGSVTREFLKWGVDGLRIWATIRPGLSFKLSNSSIVREWKAILSGLLKHAVYWVLTHSESLNQVWQKQILTWTATRRWGWPSVWPTRTGRPRRPGRPAPPAPPPGGPAATTPNHKDKMSFISQIWDGCTGLVTKIISYIRGFGLSYFLRWIEKLLLDIVTGFTITVTILLVLCVHALCFIIKTIAITANLTLILICVIFMLAIKLLICLILVTSKVPNKLITNIATTVY